MFNRQKQSKFSSGQAAVSVLVEHAEYRFFVVLHVLYCHILHPQSQQHHHHDITYIRSLKIS